jgi:hypothetical protein
MQTKTHEEVTYRLAQGQRQVSFAQFRAEYEAIGYIFDRSCDVRSTALYMTGERKGSSYPYLGLYPIQSDNRISAWHVNARKDGKYEQLQQLRNEIFAVHNNRIVEV